MKLKVVVHEAVEGCLSVDIEEIELSGNYQIMERRWPESMRVNCRSSTMDGAAPFVISFTALQL